MSHDELLDAGFIAYYPNKHLHDNFDLAYQLKVSDDIGIRYYIDVLFYNFRKYGQPYDGWALKLNYNEGLVGDTSNAQVKVSLSLKEETDSPQTAINKASEFWDRLKPKHYRVYDAEE